VGGSPCHAKSHNTCACARHATTRCQAHSFRDTLINKVPGSICAQGAGGGRPPGSKRHRLPALLTGCQVRCPASLLWRRYQSPPLPDDVSGLPQGRLEVVELPASVSWNSWETFRHATDPSLERVPALHFRRDPFTKHSTRLLPRSRPRLNHGVPGFSWGKRVLNNRANRMCAETTTLTTEGLPR
jgi:hypothetical protein